VGVDLLAVDRAGIEAYARHLEQAGRARSTVARRLASLAGFYRYAVEEAALPRSPVAHVRRPSVARDSQTLGLDREEAARFLAAAEAASTCDHALGPSQIPSATSGSANSPDCCRRHSTTTMAPSGPWTTTSATTSAPTWRSPKGR
jgi:hypothetical protein